MLALSTLDHPFLIRLDQVQTNFSGGVNPIHSPFILLSILNSFKISYRKHKERLASHFQPEFLPAAESLVLPQCCNGSRVKPEMEILEWYLIHENYIHIPAEATSLSQGRLKEPPAQNQLNCYPKKNRGISLVRSS